MIASPARIRSPPDFRPCLRRLGRPIGGSIWGIVSAVRSANDHNRSLSSGNASLTLLPTPDGGLGVGINFRL